MSLDCLCYGKHCISQLLRTFLRYLFIEITRFKNTGYSSITTLLLKLGHVDQNSPIPGYHYFSLRGKSVV